MDGTLNILKKATPRLIDLNIKFLTTVVQWYGLPHIPQ